MNYLTPLKIFVIGNLLLLISFPFFPAIGDAGNTLVATPESVAAESWAWGWSWLATTGVIKWLVYAMLEGGVMVATFVAFWRIKKTTR
ncbi:MAG: hypothetical protein IMZ53_15360 [Thermoplasmata archaeon]|nr:hypothetical protein [Thermoplasmata archaeon]